MIYEQFLVYDLVTRDQQPASLILHLSLRVYSQILPRFSPTFSESLSGVRIISRVFQAASSKWLNP